MRTRPTQSHARAWALGSVTALSIVGAAGCKPPPSTAMRVHVEMDPTTMRVVQAIRVTTRRCSMATMGCRSVVDEVVTPQGRDTVFALVPSGDAQDSDDIEIRVEGLGGVDRSAQVNIVNRGAARFVRDRVIDVYIGLFGACVGEPAAEPRCRNMGETCSETGSCGATRIVGAMPMGPVDTGATDATEAATMPPNDAGDAHVDAADAADVLDASDAQPDVLDVQSVFDVADVVDVVVLDAREAAAPDVSSEPPLDVQPDVQADVQPPMDVQADVQPDVQPPPDVQPDVQPDASASTPTCTSTCAAGLTCQRNAEVERDECCSVPAGGTCAGTGACAPGSSCMNVNIGGGTVGMRCCQAPMGMMPVCTPGCSGTTACTMTMSGPRCCVPFSCTVMNPGTCTGAGAGYMQCTPGMGGMTFCCPMG